MKLEHIFMIQEIFTTNITITAFFTFIFGTAFVFEMPIETYPLRETFATFEAFERFFSNGHKSFIVLNES